MVELRSREDLEDVLAEIEQVEGVTILIYDQFCAAEKRRYRSRGLLPQPERRILINEAGMRRLRGLCFESHLRLAATGRYPIWTKDQGPSILLQCRLYLYLGRLPFIRIGHD